MNEPTKWTHFWDMHSGGGTKEAPYEHIYIEANEKDARIIFYNRFRHSPDRVSCTCCGEDYAVSESDSIEDASGYQRSCKYAGGRYVDSPRNDQFIPMKEYAKQPDVLIIRASDIKDDERIGEVPREGYVWQ